MKTEETKVLSVDSEMNNLQSVQPWLAETEWNEEKKWIKEKKYP